jgi:hypothetical protein
MFLKDKESSKKIQKFMQGQFNNAVLNLYQNGQKKAYKELKTKLG